MPYRLTQGLASIVALLLFACVPASALPLEAQPAFDDAYIGFLFSPTRPNGLPSRSTNRDGNADRSTRQRVTFHTKEAAGTILINTALRRLYLVESDGFAQSYEVGIGREGYGWYGSERVSAKRQWPDWRPPASMLARRPDLPPHMRGGPDNPLGARALYLGETLYRIHGSNEPETVGEAASSGCFRMRNIDVIDLYNRVSVGAVVRVF